MREYAAEAARRFTVTYARMSGRAGGLHWSCLKSRLGGSKLAEEEKRHKPQKILCR